MSSSCGPDIVKYFVVEPANDSVTGATGNFFVCSGTTFLSTISGCTDSVDFNGNTFYNNSDVFFNGVITACTGVHTSNIYGCSPITVHDDLILLNKLTLSAVTQDDTLTQILGKDSSTGEVKYRSVDSILSGVTTENTFVTGSTLSGSTLLLSRNDGVELTTDLSSILFTGNTSGDCITDLYITNLYGCSPITVNDTLNLTNNARLNINATSSFTLAVESYDNNIATFRDVDGEDIFFAQGSLANQDLVFGFGDFGDAYGYAGYTLDTVLNQHNFTNGNLYLGNVSTFNTDTKLYVDGNTKVTGSLSATTFYGDGSNLTGISTDNFFVSGGTYNSGTDDINFVGNSTETTFDVDLSSLVSSVSGDTFVVSGNANAATSQLTFTNNSGGTFNVTNSAALFSDNDINVTGGTYNPNNGCVTFGTNSGTTFDVCGFLTGFTNTFSTGGTVTQSATSGDTAITLQINGNQGFNSYSITGVTDTFVNDLSFSSNTFTITQNDGTSFDSSIPTIELGNILSAVTFNIGTTGTISATTFNGNTFNGGTFNGTFVGDGSGLTGITGNDTFVTGFTYNNSNTLTISRNDGIDFTTSINIMSALTVTSLYGVTTIQDDGGELTIISDDFKIKGDGITIQDNGGNDKILIDTTISTPELSGNIFFNDNQTFGSNVFVSNILTATTISATTFYGDGSNLTGISSEDNFVTGGTFSSETLTLNRQNGSVTITGFTSDSNTFVTGFTYNDANTFTISDNNGSNYSASIDIMSGLTVNGNSVFSGTSTGVVQIFGSGSTSPLFRVQGSAGELFSITDSLIGELFAVNNISGLPILSVNSDNTILLGNNLAPSLLTTTLTTANLGAATNIYSIPISAYTGAFFDYTISSGSNLRAGNVTTIFNVSDITYNETTTNDIGNTDDLIMSVVNSGGNATLTASATTSNWEIKTIVRSI